ncbi:P-loop NTPase family protein [Rhizobium alvei]|uniref:ATPase n=1 Tax=Rhizobium alvei TaxID=1132659 RepID=A0ABT8YI45_9HYPH|nr:hypothetical protein [Rhizobium alvei]MDO6962949.1 hypothetical protein [Rhizobium alvei]
MHNRTTERNLLKRKLEAGLSIHMPAPRRIGKTWLINRLAQDLRDDGWHAVEVDVEGIRTPSEFARELCSRIEGLNTAKERFFAHARQRIGAVLAGQWGDKPMEALGKVDPIEFSAILIASLNDTHPKTAIIVDEVAYFFLALAEKDPRDANAFAYKLRAMQQQYKNVRWLITGSIGLDTIARRYGLEGAFVDFETFVLEPFKPDEARSFIRDAKIQQQITHLFDARDEDFDYMFSELGWLAPYYLKMVANEVRPSDTIPDHALPLATMRDIDAAFAKLLQPNRRSEFAVWREHVDKNLPAIDRDIAKQILGLLSRTVEGERRDTINAHLSQTQGHLSSRQTMDILSMLCNDGLIMKNGERYVFRSGLVRKYWLEYEAE